MKNSLDFTSFVREYYQDALIKHGPTPKGVDWNGSESQYLRFQIQHDMVEHLLSYNTKVLDYGCGYGEFANFLLESNFHGSYTGIDLVSDSINFAKKRFANYPNFNFTNKIKAASRFDIIFSSGVFNVYPSDPDIWLNSYIKNCLLEMSILSDLIVVNFLRPNPTKPSPNLFFPSQEEIESILPRNFHVTSIKDEYGLWEWTAVLERKEQRK